MKKSIIYCCAALCAITSGAFAQAPAISAVVNAATYVPAGIPNAAIAEGGFFAIYGTNLGPSAGVTNSGAFPTTLSNVTLSVTSGGTTVTPLLYYVSQYQINGVLPSNTPVSSSATMTVNYNGSSSAAFTFPVVESNFGFFTLSAGAGPAIAQIYPNYTLDTLTATAKPGDTVILYGTGLGPAVDNQDQVNGGAGGYGTDLRSVDNLNFHLYLGGVDATAGVLYAGRSPDVALDQINFTLPSNAPSGCFVPIIITLGNLVSNTASIAINANNDTCSDPYGLTSAQITQAATGTLNVGSILLTRLQLNLGLPTPETEDEVDAHFYQFTGGSVLTNPDFLSLSSYGSCLVSNCSNTYTCVPSESGLAIPGLDAGSQLTVTPPSETNPNTSTTIPAITASQVSTGYYSAKLGSYPIALGTAPNQFPTYDFLQPGSFKVSGSGGSAVGAFSATLAVPAAGVESPNTGGGFTFSSPQFSTSSLDVSQNTPLTVNWTGAGSTGYMLVSVGSSYQIPNSNPTNWNSTTITCLQPASAGTFTMPTWLLQALPQSAYVNVGGLNIPGAAVLLGLYNPVGTFTAPGLDVGLANSILTSGQNVRICATPPCAGPPQ